MQFDRIVEVLGLWPHYVVVGLGVPIVVGVLARKVVLTLFSALLSLLSLTLLFDPSSIGPALVVASAIGSFLIALESLIDRRRITALNTQIGELTERLVTLEAAESRRLGHKAQLAAPVAIRCTVPVEPRSGRTYGSRQNRALLISAMVGKGLVLPAMCCQARARN